MIEERLEEFYEHIEIKNDKIAEYKNKEIKELDIH